MKRVNRLMLAVGVALAALSFLAVLALGALGQQSPQATPVPDVSVVVAAADLPLGAQVTADKLTTTTKPQTDATGDVRRSAGSRRQGHSACCIPGPGPDHRRLRDHCRSARSGQVTPARPACDRGAAEQCRLGRRAAPAGRLRRRPDLDGRPRRAQPHRRPQPEPVGRRRRQAPIRTSRSTTTSTTPRSRSSFRTFRSWPRSHRRRRTRTVATLRRLRSPTWSCSWQ